MVLPLSRHQLTVSSGYAMAADLSTPSGRLQRSEKRRESAAEPELVDVYRGHQRFVYRSLGRLGVPEDRLGDAVHDVFMVVARRLSEFEGRSSMRTWLFAICMRVARAMRRDDAREHERRASMEHAHGKRHEEPHARVEAADTLRQYLARLDEDKRAVFIMAELEGMTAPEIAAALGVKIPTVYSRLRLARERLEKMVARTRARERRSGG